MDLDIAQFRTEFPEFADTTRYPDSQITFYGTLAESLLCENVWTTTWPFAVKLYVAHEITLAAQYVSSSLIPGQSPGAPTGITSNKAVGQVSVGYDTQTTAEKDAGWWNSTAYGRQLYRLARMFGAGGYQL